MITGLEKQDPTDESLAERMARGDQQALEAAIRRWERPVYSLAYRILRQAEAAQEVTQDVFLKAWMKASSFQAGRGSFASWLLTLAHHSAIDALRRQKARGGGRTQTLDGVVKATLASPGRGVSTWRKLRMEKAMARLNPAQRRVVELAYFDGLTREEMARHLGEPVGTVKTRLRDALLKLKRLFSDPEAEYQSLPEFKA